MTKRGVSHLPKEHRDALATAYADHQNVLRSGDEIRKSKAKALAQLFIAARNAGWPNAAIGDACGITGTSASRIIARHGEGVEPATSPVFPKYAGGFVPRNCAPEDRPGARELTPDEAQELAELAALARTCTGSRPLNHPSRIASLKFSDRIMRYHDDGVTWKQIADAAGMKISGVRMRAQRHGYNSGPPPSIPAYRNVVRRPNPKPEKAETVTSEDVTTSTSEVAVKDTKPTVKATARPSTKRVKAKSSKSKSKSSKRRSA